MSRISAAKSARIHRWAVKALVGGALLFCVMGSVCVHADICSALCPKAGGCWRATSSILDVSLGHRLPQIFKLTTQADNNKSICFGDMIWGSYLRRKERTNSFANRESSSLLIITHV